MNNDIDNEEIEIDPFVKAFAQASQNVAASLGQIRQEGGSETKEEASTDEENDNEEVIGGYYDSFKNKIKNLSQQYKEQQETKENENDTEEKVDTNEEQSNEEGDTQEPSEEPVDDEKSDEEKPTEETKENPEAEKEDDKTQEDNFWKNHERPYKSVHNVVSQFHERYIEVLEKKLGIIYEDAAIYRELDEYEPFSITKKFYLGKDQLEEVFQVDFFVSFLSGLYHELNSDPKFSEKYNSLLQNLKKIVEEALKQLNDQKHNTEKYNFESVVRVMNKLEENLSERTKGVLSMARNHVLKSLDKALGELA